MSVYWCISYSVGYAISTVTVCLGHRKETYKLGDLLSSSLKIFFTHTSQNICLAPTHVFSKLSIEKCLLYPDKSKYWLRHQEMSEFWCKLAFRPKSMCLHIYTCACFIHRFLSADYLMGCYLPFSVLDGCKPMCSGNFSQIHSACLPTISRKPFSSLLRLFVFTYCKNDCYMKKSVRMFSDVT